MESKETNPTCAQSAQPSSVSNSDLQKMVKDRRTVDADALAVFARNAVCQSETASNLTRPLLLEVKRRFKNLPQEKGVDGKHPTIDGARSFNQWLEIHQIAKRNVYYTLAGGKPTKRKPLPPWGNIEGVKVDEIFSSLHKSVRDGEEDRALGWMQRLHENNYDVWKQLFLYAVEDIGLADLTVKTHLLAAEEEAKALRKAKKSDWPLVVDATMRICGAEKSRTTDDAAIWLRENPLYSPPISTLEPFEALMDRLKAADETGAMAVMRRLYLVAQKRDDKKELWKLLHRAANGLGTSVKLHVSELERVAERLVDDRHSDLLAILEAVLLISRAMRFQTTHDPQLGLRETATYTVPTDKQIEACVGVKLPQPVVLDKDLDMHTARGRKLDRGMKHFKEVGAVLANKSDVPDFQPPLFPATKSPITLTDEQVRYLAALLEREQDGIAADLRAILVASTGGTGSEAAPKQLKKVA